MYVCMYVCMYVYDKIYLQLIHVTGTYDRSMVRWIGNVHQPHGVQRYDGSTESNEPEPSEMWRCPRPKAGHVYLWILKKNRCQKKIHR